MPRAPSVCSKPGCPETATDHGRCSAHRWEVVGTGSRGSSRAERAERLEILEAAGHRCFYCRGPATIVDHFIPLAKGGSKSRANKVAACFGCNSAKGSLMPDEFMRRLARARATT